MAIVKGKLFVRLSVVVQAPMLTTTSPNDSTIFVNWTSVEHAVLYTLCIIREGSSSRHKVNTTDTVLTFDGLEAGTTYCIKGTAWDSEGRPGDDLTVCQITRKQHGNHYVKEIQLTPTTIKHPLWLNFQVPWAQMSSTSRWPRVGPWRWPCTGCLCRELRTT